MDLGKPLDNGFQNSPLPCFERVFFLKSALNHSFFCQELWLDFITLLVYIDDIIITNNNKEEVDMLKCYLDNQFKLKDMGYLKYYFWIRDSLVCQGHFHQLVTIFLKIVVGCWFS